MAKRRKADFSSPSPAASSSAHAGSNVSYPTPTSTSTSTSTGPGTGVSSSAAAPTTRRRGGTRDGYALMSAAHPDVTPKVIDAAPSLAKAEMYGIDHSRTASSKLLALAGRIFIETIPQWLAVGSVLALIFGGCCSNVFALEAIIKVEPDSGTLLTFVQFVFVAVTGYISHFDPTRPPFFLTPNKVPLKRWLLNIVLFFSINVLNNHAFSYDISVPIHIILRSGGSVMTMVAGFLYGKKYTPTQIGSVLLLTLGVVTAAWADAQSKNKTSSSASSSSFGTGLTILLLAQILSAIMGLYTEETYREYGPHWKENLFYSHLLSLPLFIPFLPSMTESFGRLAASPPLAIPLLDRVRGQLTTSVVQAVDELVIPSQLAYLMANVFTQYACIRGVNLLAAATSALTVTIVLNMRKLVSLLLSIWLFENQLATGTLLGAMVVFAAGGMYSLNGTSKPARSRPRLGLGSRKTTQQTG